MSYTRALCLVCHFSATRQYRNSSEGCRQLQVLFWKPVAVAATFWSSVLRRATADTAFSAGVIAPLVYPGFFVETMSAICTLSKSVLENGHAGYRPFAFGSCQEQAIGHSFSGDARRPCCCNPLEPGTVAWCWSLGSCRSALFAAGLFVLGAVRRPIQLHLGRLLLAVLKEPSTGPLLSGAVRRPCCCALPPSFGCRLSALLTVLKALSTGPLLLGAVRRPCCCRPFCFGCRLPAHSTVLGDVCQQDNVPMCLLVVAFTPKACASVESQTQPLLA